MIEGDVVPTADRWTSANPVLRNPGNPGVSRYKMEARGRKNPIASGKQDL